MWATETATNHAGCGRTVVVLASARSATLSTVHGKISVEINVARHRRDRICVVEVAGHVTHTTR